MLNRNKKQAAEIGSFKCLSNINFMFIKIYLFLFSSVYARSAHYLSRFFESLIGHLVESISFHCF